MRVCTKCGNDKPLDDFYDLEHGSEGKMSWCKSCFNDHTNKRRAKERMDAGAREFKFVEIGNDTVTCRWCNRTLPIERFVKQYNKTANNAPVSNRCKDCDNLRKRDPAAWEDRDKPGVIIDALRRLGVDV